MAVGGHQFQQRCRPAVPADRIRDTAYVCDISGAIADRISFFVSAFALFGIGLHYRVVGWMLIFCLLISTSSSAYAGLLLLFPVAILIYARQADGRAALMLTVFALTLGSAWVADQVCDGRGHQQQLSDQQALKHLGH